MEVMEVKISPEKFAEELGFQVLFNGDDEEITLSTFNVSRPGLQLTGFFDYFAANRIQVLGNAESFYLSCLDDSIRHERLEMLFKADIPCLIYSRKIMPTIEVFNLAKKYNCPIFSSELVTSILINKLVMYLNSLLAPSIAEHACLIDVYGVGMMITGKSGIGKSETALELVKRGHRLVADDSVIIKRINNELVGTSPELIRYFMEVRGIGIIDIRSMYGVGAVLKEKQINCVVTLEKWTEGKEYDRLGDEIITTSILDVELPRLEIPVKPGRNLAIIMEVAAMNYRLKNFGYDSTQELIKRSMLQN